MDVKLASLYQSIQYTFSNVSVLKNALTHRSVGAVNNERLEFLGDSILSFLISEHLFAHFPNASEGDLSRLRSSLVKGDTLAELAREISLGDYLLLGQGELGTGGHQRSSILADAFEALIAAIFLDGGIQAARDVILCLYRSRLVNDQLFLKLKDPKTHLQELLQSRQCPLPLYRLQETVGLDHEQLFVVECSAPSLAVASIGRGSTRRKAEQLAASELIDKIKPIPHNKKKRKR